MKNPLLTIIALLVLAGVLFAQSFPPGGGAHPIIRKIELVGPIQVEGIVPLKNHISIPWACSLVNGVATPFEWTCPPGMNARVTHISDTDGGFWSTHDSHWKCSYHLATGDFGYIAWGRGGIVDGVRDALTGGMNYATNPQPILTTVLHPEDALRIDVSSNASTTIVQNGILQLAVQYD